jgi:hypothetical protein
MLPAIETIERWTLAGKFGKRAQRTLCVKLSSDAQTQKLGFLPCGFNRARNREKASAIVRCI